MREGTRPIPREIAGVFEPARPAPHGSPGSRPTPSPTMPLPVLAELANWGSSNRSGRRRPAWGEPSVSIRRPARSLGRVAGAWPACRLIRHMKDARRPGEDLASSPLSNHLYRSRRIGAPSAHWSQLHGRLRLGCAKGLGQGPRNGGEFADGPRTARSVSGLADWLAERAVQREPVSAAQIP
jgi:hypothetical protein